MTDLDTAYTANKEAGNVWFVGTEPDEPMTAADALMLLAILSASTALVGFAIGLVVGLF